jgi:hypothetical protein
MQHLGKSPNKANALGRQKAPPVICGVICTKGRYENLDYRVNGIIW